MALDQQSAPLDAALIARNKRLRHALRPKPVEQSGGKVRVAHQSLDRREIDDFAGVRPVLGVSDVRVFRHGFNDQSAELWSDDGELLAVSNQVVWFKA